MLVDGRVWGNSFYGTECLMSYRYDYHTCSQSLSSLTCGPMGGRKKAHCTYFTQSSQRQVPMQRGKWLFNYCIERGQRRKYGKSLFYKAVSRHTLLILESSQNKLKGQPPAIGIFLLNPCILKANFLRKNHNCPFKLSTIRYSTLINKKTMAGQ